MNDPRREIPSVDSLLSSEPFHDLLASQPRSLVLRALRAVLNRLRAEPHGEAARALDPSQIAEATRLELEAANTPSLRRVINATGIPLHTNLGRAPLASAARTALLEVATGYSNLEYDLERGSRGSRHGHCAELLAELTGAGGALIVNNNAAAVVLGLNELAEGREAIVSRGELVEIGGSFRVPEIIAKSGARIVEVGATNRTHPGDYEGSIGPETGVLLKVHRSNFQQSGFVSEVGVDALVQIGRRHGVSVMYDLGSGLLPDAEGSLGLPFEPSVRDSLRAGVDLLSFSADKLLGGPQAGVLVGRSELIDRLRTNPLLRALRVGKLTLAALEATLRLWRDLATARTHVPAIAMLTADGPELKERAQRLAVALRQRAPQAEIEIVAGVTEVGAGSYPGVEIATWLLQVTVAGRSERELEAACRAGRPPVVGRIRDGALLLDPRTVLVGEEEPFVRVLAEAIAGGG